MAEISIKVNGKDEFIKEGSNLLGLLEIKEINPEIAVVKLNEDIIDKGQLAEKVLQAADQLEITFFMGGGSFDFTEEEIERYSRHIILKDIGGTGQ